VRGEGRVKGSEKGGDATLEGRGGHGGEMSEKYSRGQVEGEAAGVGDQHAGQLQDPRRHRLAGILDCCCTGV